MKPIRTLVLLASLVLFALSCTRTRTITVTVPVVKTLPCPLPPPPQLETWPDPNSDGTTLISPAQALFVLEIIQWVNEAKRLCTDSANSSS